jgi:hypothetical protein
VKLETDAALVADFHGLTRHAEAPLARPRAVDISADRSTCTWDFASRLDSASHRDGTESASAINDSYGRSAKSVSIYRDCCKAVTHNESILLSPLTPGLDLPNAGVLLPRENEHSKT